MASFKRDVADPNLSFSGGSTPRGGGSRGPSSTSAGLEVLGQVAKIGMEAYGAKKATKAGEEISGQNETHVEAGKAVQEATMLQGMFEDDTKLNQGRPPTKNELNDFRDETFGNLLTNQKRIQQAVEAGAISSSEGNARLGKLRAEALSNPLTAAHQDKLDNILFKSTGGAAPSNGLITSTPYEQQQAREAENRAAGEAQLMVASESLLQSGVVPSISAAKTLIGQSQQAKLQKSVLDTKRLNKTMNSEDAFSSQQLNLEDYSVEGYKAVQTWLTAGGNAADQDGLVANLDLLHRTALSDLRKNAPFMTPGNFTTAEKQLTTQQASLNTLMKDRSATENITKVFNEVQVKMDRQNQKFELKLTQALPYLQAYNKYGGQEGVGFYMRLATNDNQMSDKVLEHMSPIMRTLKKLDMDARAVFTGQQFETFEDPTVLQLPADTKAYFGEILTQQGGFKVLLGRLEDQPEDTIRKVGQSDMNLRSIVNSREWMNLSNTDQGKELIRASVKGGASSAKVSTIGQFGTVPSKVSVTQRDKQVGGKTEGTPFTIDTFGVETSATYKQQVVSAYQLAKIKPELWQNEYDNIDEYLTANFAIGGAQAETPPPFEARAERPQDFPFIDNGNGSISTHRMAAEVDEDGNWRAFPTIVQMPNGTLKEFEDVREAERYNKSIGNTKEFGKDKAAALKYAEGGYKPKQLKDFGKGRK